MSDAQLASREASGGKGPVEDKKKEDDDGAVPVFWLYNWFSRGTWLGWLFRGEGLAILAATGFIAGVATWTVRDAMESARLAREAPRVAAVEQIGQGSSAFLIFGNDTAGREGVFDVIVSNKSVGWVRGSVSSIDKDGAVLDAAGIKAEVFGEEIRQRLAQSSQVIAVGLASQEGRRLVETQRARRRAVQTAEWLRIAAPDAPPIRTLNLGQYQVPCEACESEGTSWQRPLIVIGVRSLADGTNVREALMDAMAKTTNLPQPEAYSSFDLEE